MTTKNVRSPGWVLFCNTVTHSRLSVRMEAGLPNFRIGQLMIECTQQEFKDKSHYDTLPILSKPNFTRQNLNASLSLSCVASPDLTSHSGKDENRYIGSS